MVARNGFQVGLSVMTLVFKQGFIVITRSRPLVRMLIVLLALKIKVTVGIQVSSGNTRWWILIRHNVNIFIDWSHFTEINFLVEVNLSSNTDAIVIRISSFLIGSFPAKYKEMKDGYHDWYRIEKGECQTWSHRSQFQSSLEVTFCCWIFLFSHRKASGANIANFVHLWKAEWVCPQSFFLLLHLSLIYLHFLLVDLDLSCSKPVKGK